MIPTLSLVVAASVDQPPAVDWWARGIALGAAAVSLMALAWQVAQWRLNGPRVRVRLWVRAELQGRKLWSKTFRGHESDYRRAHRETDRGVLVELKVTNRGRSPISIDGFGLRINGGERVSVTYADLPNPELPVELQAHTTKTFVQSFSGLLVNTKVGTPPYKVRGVVELGDGKTKWSPRRRLKIPGLD